jgi:FkbM family methyltransferase
VLKALRLIPEPVYRRLKGNVLLSRTLDRLMPRGRFAETKIRGGPLKGLILELDPRTNKDMALGRYEPNVVDRLSAMVPPGTVVFDVGAHLGYESIVMARAAGGTGKVVCFEPDPGLAQKLAANIARNSTVVGADLLPVQAAIAASRGKVAFEPGRTTGTGRLSPGADGVEVETLTLDEAARLYGTPAVVKVDVEGHELDVLAGAERLLEKGETAFLVEAHSPELTRACVELFESSGYVCERIGEADRGGAHIVATTEGRPKN